MVVATDSTQATRLFELRRKSGLSQRDVAARIKKSGLSLTDARISAYEKDETIRIKMPVLRKLAEIYKTTTEYIETGKHPKSDAEQSAALPTESNLRFLHPATQEEYLILPFVPVRARASFVERAGTGSDYGDLDTMRVYNPSPELRKDGSITIEINGDSMEPQLRSGMCVAAYALDPSDFKYATSGVYVVDFGSSIVIKRIKDNDLLRNGTLTLHSDNTRAGSLTIQDVDLRRLWRVMDIVKGRVE